ncbi:MAG: undecaprenyldiphospho-muramoylpentapeptide beta-N-acetylglucosaminyltransferase [Capnocytophaga sp.]|nr:undecaprenyldiphospho-muramoylpentapeptide beta-N-acetylglucosaminyltransferase [Capnocytophaga sp.]
MAAQLIKKYKFIVSGGGTGGHIYPAIAIADGLRKRFPSSEILFVGANNKMEMQKVPEAGYPIEGLRISGLQRKLTAENLSFPLKLIGSMLKSRRILKKFKPDAVIGTGGFASGPLLKVAEMKGIPTLIQEQNSYAGITNKWLAKKASKICVAYDGMEKFFPKEKIVHTGNPVRSDLLSLEGKKEEALAHFGLQETKKTVLVLGGSLGARAINQLIESRLSLFEKLNVQVLWQCGKFYYEQYKTYNSAVVKVVPFISRMDWAYAIANCIISRAGAGSVSELCIVGKPAIFIPSPNVAEDHQTKNAQAVAEKQAAVVLKEKDLEADFSSVFTDVITDEALQKSLSENIRRMAKPNATEHIIDQIEILIQS